jgi:hypothetical protein
MGRCAAHRAVQEADADGVGECPRPLNLRSAAEDKMYRKPNAPPDAYALGSMALHLAEGASAGPCTSSTSSVLIDHKMKPSQQRSPIPWRQSPKYCAPEACTTA